MGLRQRGYWLRQSDAIRRQFVATIAHGIGLGMADENSRQEILDNLELTETLDDSKAKQSALNWDMLFALGGGKGV